MSDEPGRRPAPDPPGPPPAAPPPPRPLPPAGLDTSATADRQLLAAPTRQSPIAVVFIAWRFIRNLGAVNLGVAILFLVSGRLSGALLGFGVVAATVLLVSTLLAWWRFVFTVDGAELLVAKGVVAQERLTIPLDRIQSVSIDQRFLHRLVGLVAVSVDTAGSSAAELEIQAVDRRRAEALQRLAAGQHPDGELERSDDLADAAGGPAAGPATGTGPGRAVGREDHLVARTPIELVKVGVSRWPWAGLVALAPLAAFAGDYADRLIEPIEERVIEDNLPTEFGTGAVAALVAIVVGLIVLGAVLGTVLQMVRTLVTDWNLHLTRTATGFRRTAGLLSRTSKASTLTRIQAIQTDETPIERWFGMRRVTLPTIGEGDLSIPGASPVELARIRGEVFDQTPPPTLDRMISPAYVFLAVRNQLLLAVPVTALLAITFGRWALVVLLIVPLRWWTAGRRRRLWRWGISAHRVAERYEVVNRHTAEIELVKTQTVQVGQSFFERRRGLATVRITNAEGFLEVPLIPLAEAEAVRDRVLHRVESDRRAWM